MKKDDYYKDVIYFDIVRANKTLLHLDGSKVNGLTKYDLQKLIGDNLGEGTFSYSMNISGKRKNQTGKIRAIVTDDKKRKENNLMDAKVLDQINDLNKKIESLTKSPDLDLIVNLTKQSYETQLAFYKDRVQHLEREKDKLEVKIEKLESELQENSGGSFDTILQAVQMFTKLKTGGKAVNTLSDVPSNPDNIPNEILTELGKVNWDSLNEQQKENLIQVFNQFGKYIPKNEAQEV